MLWAIIMYMRFCFCSSGRFYPFIITMDPTYHDYIGTTHTQTRTNALRHSRTRALAHTVQTHTLTYTDTHAHKICCILLFLTCALCVVFLCAGCTCDDGMFGTPPDCAPIPILVNISHTQLSSVAANETFYITDEIYGTGRTSIGTTKHNNRRQQHKHNA